MNNSAIMDRLSASALETVELSFGDSHARLTLQGAHLVSYIHKGVERLWMSPKTNFEIGQPIRGGVPICWPWFGPHSNDASRPAHGFARTANWTLKSKQQESNSAQLTLSLESKDPDYPLTVDFRVELSDASLTMTLITRNCGDQKITLNEALHTYLTISDLSKAFIEGLTDCRFADKLADYKESIELRQQVYLTEPTDRVYYDQSAELRLTDSGSGSLLKIGKHGSGATVVWNAGADIASTMLDLGADNYRSYLCIEAANALQASVELEPGATHTLSQSLTCVN